MFYGLELSDILSIIFIYSFLIIGLIGMIKIYIKERHNKKLKTEGKGVLVKTKIIKIKRIYHSGENSRDPGYYSYAIISIDKDGNKFQSKDIYNAEYTGRIKEEMLVKYGGKEYDLTEKDKVVPELKKVLSEYESELNEHWGLLNHFKLKSARKKINEYIDIANEGLITPYIIKNDHKISIGDEVNVYVDWEKYKEDNENENIEDPMYDQSLIPPNYYFDIDFINQGKKIKLNKGKWLIIINLFLLIVLAGLILLPKYIKYF